MGKLDDMRRAREAKHGAAEAVAGESAGEVDEGRCPVCHKRKAVHRGVMVSHQKGLGKRCAGSGAPPV